MLTVRIYSQGTYKDYDNDVQSVSISTRNERGAPFTTETPQMSANIVFSLVDTFLENVKGGDLVKIWNDDTADGLTVEMTINEISLLYTKNNCEIYASIDLFKDLTAKFGNIEFSDMSWSDFQKRFNIFEFIGYENTGDVNVSLTKKEDIALGMVWNDEQRKSLSATPFTTFDDKFSESGIGMFPDNVNNLISPEYKIEPKNITNYDVESAQEGITHIQPYALGKSTTIKSVPATTFKSPLSDIKDNKPDDKQSKFFKISGIELSAVYTKSSEFITQYLKIAEFSQLLWSDGKNTLLEGFEKVNNFKILSSMPENTVLTGTGLFFNIEPFSVVSGITINPTTGEFSTVLVGEWIAFIEYKFNGITFIKSFIISRDELGNKSYILNTFAGGEVIGIFSEYFATVEDIVTGSQIGQQHIFIYDKIKPIYPIASFNISVFEKNGLKKVTTTYKIEDPNNKTHFLLLFSSPNANGDYGIVYKEGTGFRIAQNNNLKQMRKDFPAELIAVNRANILLSSTPVITSTSIRSLYYTYQEEGTSAYSRPLFFIYYSFDKQDDDYILGVKQFINPLNSKPIISGYDYIFTPVDFISSGPSHTFYVLWKFSNGILCQKTETSSSETRWIHYIDFYHTENDYNFNFIFSDTLVNPLKFKDDNMTSNILLVYTKFNVEEDDDGNLIELSPPEHIWEEMTESINDGERVIKASGNIKEMIESNAYSLYFNRNSMGVIASKGGIIWESFMQNCINPLDTRELIPTTYPIKISDGLENILQLPFFVEKSLDKTKYNVNSVKGRIYLTIDSFSVKNNTSENWKEKAASDLNIPALNSYCHIQVEDETVLAKIINIRFDYRGASEISLTALIV